MQSAIEAIRSCQYLYLHSISESDNNALELLLHEAIVGDPPDEDVLAREQIPSVRKLVAESRSIVHAPGCKIFRLVWSTFVGYSVENESYALPEPKESIGEGRLFTVFTQSVYLDYLAKATFASNDYPGRFKHWAIYCIDHIVNVASIETPRIHVTTSGA